MISIRKGNLLYLIIIILIGCSIYSYMHIHHEIRYPLVLEEMPNMESMKLCVHEGNEFREAKAIFEEGEMQYKGEYFSAALTHFLQSLKLFTLTTADDWRAFCLCRIAKCYQMVGEINFSSEYYMQAIALSKKINHDHLYYNILRLSTRTLSLLGKVEEAQIALTELIKKASSRSCSAYELCQCLLENTYLSIMKGDYISAKKDLVYFFEINKKHTFVVLEAEALRLRGQLVMLDKFDYSSAKKDFIKALDLFKTYNNKVGQAAVLILLGELLYKQKNIQEALSYFDRAYTMYHQLDDKISLIFLLLQKNVLTRVPESYANNSLLLEVLEKGQHRPYYFESLIFLARNAIESCNLNQAYLYLTKILKSVPELNNKPLECTVYTLLGEIEKKNRNFELAQENLAKAIKISQEMHYSKSYINALLNLCSVELLLHNSRKSLINLYYILKLAKKYKYTYEIAKCYFYLGTSHMYNGDVTYAEQSFKKAAIIFSNQNCEFELGETIFYQAQLEIYCGRFGNADALNQRCLEIFEHIQNNEYIAKATSLIAYASFARGNHQFARDFYKRAEQLAQATENMLLLFRIQIQDALIDVRENKMTTASIMVKNNEQLIKQLDDKHLLTELIYIKALIDFNKGFFIKALQEIQEGIKYCDYKEHFFLRMLLNILKAKILLITGKDDDVLRLTHQIREHAEKTKCLSVISDVYQTTALLNIRQSNLDEARMYANQALKVAEEINNPQHIGGSYSCLASIEHILGNHSFAKEYAEKALSYYININYRSGLIKINILLSQIALKNHDASSALQIISNALLYSQHIDNKEIHGETLTHLAKIYVFEEKYEEARSIYKKALVIFKQSNNKFFCTRILSELSHIELYLGHFEQSFVNLNEAQALCKTMQDENALFEIFKQFGNLYRTKINYGKAATYYARALAITKELNLLHEEGHVLYEMLIMDMDQFQWDAAKSKGDRAIRLLKNDPYLSSIIWTKMGIIERLQNHYEQSRICLNTALKILMNTTYKTEKARVLHEMGTLEILRENERKGRFYYNESLALYQGCGNKMGVGKLYISISLLEFAKRNTNEAIQKLKDALSIFQTTKNPFWQGMTLLGLSRMYQKVGKQTEARFYLQESQKMEKKFGIMNKNIINFYGFKNDEE